MPAKDIHHGTVTHALEKDGLATDLAASVPKTDIVLAWHESKLGKYTEYAVA